MKTAKRKVSLLLAVLLLTASLSACRRERQDAGEETLSDDLYSYRISIDGHVYSLPCPVSEFEANGWEICSSQEPAAESIAPGESDGYDCVME